MDDADDGNLEPDHGPDLRSETASGVDHVLGDDGAVLGDHFPGPIRSPADVDDTVAKVNFSAPRARVYGHGVGAAGGVGVPVARCVDSEQHALCIQKRMKLGDLRRTDEVAFRTDGTQHPLHVVIPIDLVLAGREPDSAAAMPTGRLPGLRLQLLVKMGAVLMDLGHAEASHEVGDECGRVPGHAGSELTLLDQDHIGPPLLGQVVEERDPHDPSADNDNARVRLHLEDLPCFGSSCGARARLAAASTR